MIIKIFLILIILSSPAFSMLNNDYLSTLAIIGEAENQGFHGRLLVACGIRNRGSLKGVYGLNGLRVINHLYDQRMFENAYYAWNQSKNPDNCKEIDGATHWENVKKFGRPSWSKNMIETFSYKDHVFFRER